MYVGTITFVASNKQSGIVSPNDSDIKYDFKDPNFPNTGLAEGDECKFDLSCTNGDPSSCTASNLQPCTISKTVIDSVHNGDLNIGQDEEVVVRSGGEVNGNINISGGILKVKGDGKVNGSVSGDKGSNVILRDNGTIQNGVTINGSTIKVAGGRLVGDLSLDNESSGTVKTGGEVNGNLNISHASGLKVKEQGVINGVSVNDTDCFFKADSGGEVNGNLNISPGYKIVVS
jgi:hypothetical protein